MTRRILICDDDTRRAQRFARAVAAIPEVGEHFTVESFDVEEFGRAAQGLYTRRARARRRAAADTDTDPAGGQPTSIPDTGAAADPDPAGARPSEPPELAHIDGADILVLDYDLTPNEDEQKDPDNPSSVSYLAGGSGEMMAYLARCYSRCGYIVVFNQELRVRTFHLTMQRYVDSFAELNLYGPDLEQRGLWLGSDPAEDWRPSHWPALIKAAQLHARRLQAVRDAGLDANVLNTLGFDMDDRDRLDPRQVDALAEEDPPDGASGEPGTVVDLDEITFRDLLRNRRVGLDPRDKQPDLDLQERIAAAAVGRWLDHLILPAQNVVIDAPHLRHFYPTLGHVGDPVTSEPPGSEFDRIPARARELRRPASGWFERWTCAVADAQEAAFQTTDEPTGSDDRAFCEDTSTFVVRAEAKRFTSDVPGPYVERYVKRLRSDVVYVPPNRLS